MRKITGIILSVILFPACTAFKTPEIREPKDMKVRVLRWVGNQPVVRIESHCYNQNGLGFTFKGGELDLKLENYLLGHAVVDTSFYVEAHADFMVPIQLQLDAVRMGETGMDLTKPVRVRVDGTMKGYAWGITRTLPVHYDSAHVIDLIMNYPVDGQKQ
ncbi:LEA/WHy family protein [Flavitalea flava]